jgi:Holliday junction resolvase
MIRDSRAPKLLGDFGEGLATYVLLSQGFEVAVVDHVGADLIAVREGHRLAVSVKTRKFRSGSTEHRSITVENEHLGKLDRFADRFGMTPIFCHVVSVADEHVIHVFLIPVALLREGTLLSTNKTGFSLRFHKPQDLERLATHKSLGYARFTQNELRPLPFKP